MTTAPTPSQALAEAVAHLVTANAGPVCRADPELWFSTDEDDRAEAAHHCRRCPIARTCHAAAVANDERHGVWGGTDFTRTHSTPGRRTA